ncbi:protein-disulfide reductase DsbD family protein [Acuticoccus sp.]|uniref:protein-disulfide reductase DsbD family protein n=1 Tax=Acuticoccus sp. TaxID=1904378 RepID=UPI003B522CF1
MPRVVLLVLAALIAGLMPARATVATIAAEHIEAEIALRNVVTAPGEAVDVAIRHEVAPGWHTYWINPGDSGEPPILDWSLEGGSAGDLRFPAPEALPYPPLMNHGYEERFTLLTDLTVPSDWPVGRPWPVSVRIDWLVCADICIPEGGTASFEVPTGPLSEADSGVAFTFVQAEWALPEPSDAPATYEREDGRLLLTVPGATAQDAHFFAFDRQAIAHAEPQEAVPTADGVRLTLVPGRGALDGTLSGVLTTADGAVRLTATGAPDMAPLAAAAPAAPVALPVAPEEAVPSTATGPRGATLALWQAAGLAFLGGLLLNLMPCVFPVLAVKALGLVAHADERPARRAAVGAAYTAGVLVTLAIVASVLLGLRAAGEAVGWGFQLQSPEFVATMTLLLFLFGLNLSGVFEVGAALTRFGGVGATSGPAAAFSTGLLAVVVATPCTAPFMGPAMGAALVAAPSYAAAVFAALGIGLALPFAALAVAPGAARLLPRPGVWMVRVRQALAFPLYLTAAWLLWVLAQLTSVDALLFALAALVLAALAAWLYGLSQRGDGPSHRAATGLAAAALAAALVALWPAVGAGPASAIAARAPGGEAVAADGSAFIYTPERLATLRAAERPVFLNVTAAWCITCKVNERTVLASDAFRTALVDHGVTYLMADWTRRDPDVTRLIERFGRAGVPLYVHYPATGDPVVLPQILSSSRLEAAFSGG